MIYRKGLSTKSEVEKSDMVGRNSNEIATIFCGSVCYVCGGSPNKNSNQ